MLQEARGLTPNTHSEDGREHPSDRSRHRPRAGDEYRRQRVHRTAPDRPMRARRVRCVPNTAQRGSRICCPQPDLCRPLQARYREMRPVPSRGRRRSRGGTSGDAKAMCTEARLAALKTAALAGIEVDHQEHDEQRACALRPSQSTWTLSSPGLRRPRQSENRNDLGATPPPRTSSSGFFARLRQPQIAVHL